MTRDVCGWEVDDERHVARLPDDEDQAAVRVSPSGYLVVESLQGMVGVPLAVVAAVLAEPDRVAAAVRAERRALAALCQDALATLDAVRVCDWNWSDEDDDVCRRLREVVG